MKLTRVQRQRLFAGEAPRISGEGKPPVEQGETIQLSSRLSIRVLRVNLGNGRWKLDYEVLDRRDPVRNLRRTPAPQDFDAIRRSYDEYGTPTPPTAEVIKEAAEGSAYTSSRSSLADAGEAVDAASQAAITRRAKEELTLVGQHQLSQEAAKLATQLARTVEVADRYGLDVRSEARLIARKLDGIREKLRRKAA
ncbi:MAG: hypothetical protein M3355_11950 [Actinomycetota bacterium]|nr:hypothetical protein [Actinomycetota bacterium]